MSPGDWKLWVPGHLQSQAVQPGMKPWGLSLRPARRPRQGPGSACSAGAWAVGRGMVGSPILLSDLLLRLLPSMRGDPGPLPGAPSSVRHIVSTFPQAVRMSSQPPAHTVCGGWGWGLQGDWFVLYLPGSFPDRCFVLFWTSRKQAVSFPFCPWGGLLGRGTGMSVEPWGTEDSDLSPVAVSPKQPLPEGYREPWTGQGNDRVKWEMQKRGSEERGDKGNCVVMRGQGTWRRS